MPSRTRRIELPDVVVDGYSAQAVNGEDAIDLGDRANDAALFDVLDERRRLLQRVGGDPLKGLDSDDLSESDLDEKLKTGDAKTRKLIDGTARRFGEQFAEVIAKFLGWSYWRGTERVAIGGGFAGTRLSEVAVPAASARLAALGVKVDLQPIVQHSDEAGLIGSLYLFPRSELRGCNAMVAVDLGGTKCRVGVVQFELGKGALPVGSVWDKQVWRHRGEAKSRKDILKRMAKMIVKLERRAAEADLRLAPSVGVGCPGILDAEGRILAGAQNLPGDWHEADFVLADALAERLRKCDCELDVRVGNDAVIQGLSQLPMMQSASSWGVFTIGTGLGNAHFTNKR